MVESCAAFGSFLSYVCVVDLREDKKDVSQGYSEHSSMVATIVRPMGMYVLGHLSA